MCVSFRIFLLVTSAHSLTCEGRRREQGAELVNSHSHIGCVLETTPTENEKVSILIASFVSFMKPLISTARALYPLRHMIEPDKNSLLRNA